MTQPSFSWSRDVNLPIAGKTPRRRHASATGAQVAANTRPSLVLAYLALLERSGWEGMSDHEAADALGRLHTSINSTRNGLGALIEESGSYQHTAWGTKRTRYRVKESR